MKIDTTIIEKLKQTGILTEGDQEKDTFYLPTTLRNSNVKTHYLHKRSLRGRIQNQSLIRPDSGQKHVQLQPQQQQPDITAKSLLDSNKKKTLQKTPKYGKCFFMHSSTANSPQKSEQKGIEDEAIMMKTAEFPTHFLAHLNLDGQVPLQKGGVEGQLPPSALLRE